VTRSCLTGCGRQFLGGEAQIAFESDRRVTLAVVMLLTALAVAQELGAAMSCGVGALGLGDLGDFDHLCGDGVVGADDEVGTVVAVFTTVTCCRRGR